MNIDDYTASMVYGMDRNALMFTFSITIIIIVIIIIKIIIIIIINNNN